MATLSNSEQQLLTRTIGGILGHNIIGLPLYLIGRWLSKEHRTGSRACYAISIVFEAVGLFNSFMSRVMTADGTYVREANLAAALVCIVVIILDVRGLKLLKADPEEKHKTNREIVKNSYAFNMDKDTESVKSTTQAGDMLDYDALADEVFAIGDEYRQATTNVLSEAGINPYAGNRIVSVPVALATTLYEYSVMIVRRRLKTKYKGKKALFEAEDNRMIEAFANKLMISPVGLQKIVDTANVKEWKEKLTVEAGEFNASATPYMKRIEDKIKEFFSSPTKNKDATAEKEVKEVSFLGYAGGHREVRKGLTQEELVARVFKIAGEYANRAIDMAIDERGMQFKPQAVAIANERLQILSGFGATLMRRGIKQLYRKDSELHAERDWEFMKMYAAMMGVPFGLFYVYIDGKKPRYWRKQLDVKKMSYPVIPANKYFDQIEDLMVDVFGVEVLNG